MCSEFLNTKHNQFGLKKGHGTDLGVFALKVEHYILLCPVCYINVSKAFDSINQCKLFDKLLNRNSPNYCLIVICMV